MDYSIVGFWETFFVFSWGIRGHNKKRTFNHFKNKTNNEGPTVVYFEQQMGAMLVNFCGKYHF